MRARGVRSIQIQRRRIFRERACFILVRCAENRKLNALILSRRPQLRLERHRIGAGHSAEAKAAALADHIHRGTIGRARALVHPHTVSRCVHSRGAGAVDRSHGGQNTSKCDSFRPLDLPFPRISTISGFVGLFGNLFRFGSAIGGRASASTAAPGACRTWARQCRRSRCPSTPTTQSTLIRPKCTRRTTTITWCSSRSTPPAAPTRPASTTTAACCRRATRDRCISSKAASTTRKSPATTTRNSRPSNWRR